MTGRGRRCNCVRPPVGGSPGGTSVSVGLPARTIILTLWLVGVGMLACGVAIAYQMYASAVTWEKGILRTDFANVATDRMGLIQKGFDHYLGSLQEVALSLDGRMTPGSSIPRAALNSTARHLASRHPGIAEISMFQIVNDTDRAAYEAFMATQNGSSILAFNLTYRGPADRADQYIPLTYNFRRNSNGINAEGIDSMQVKGLSTLNLQAGGNGQCRAERMKMLSFWPFYTDYTSRNTDVSYDSRMTSQAGSLSMTIDPELMFETSIFTVLPEDLYIRLADDSPPALNFDGILIRQDTEPFLAAFETHKNNVSEGHLITDGEFEEAFRQRSDEHLVRTGTVTFAMHDINVTIVASDAFIAARTSNNPLIILVVTILSSLFLVSMMLAVSLFLRSREQARAKAIVDGERAQREQAEAARAAHEKTLGYACHELRNPLHGLSASAGFLLESIPRGHELWEDVEAIVMGAEQMHRVVNDVLDWDKLKAGKLALKPEWCKLRPLLVECVSMHAAMRGDGVRVLCRVGVDVGDVVWLDGMRLRQLLSNGLTNALKWLCVQVRNTGAGLRGIDVARLFDPFGQPSSSSNTQKQSSSATSLALDSSNGLRNRRSHNNQNRNKKLSVLQADVVPALIQSPPNISPTFNKASGRVTPSGTVAYSPQPAPSAPPDAVAIETLLSPVNGDGINQEDPGVAVAAFSQTQAYDVLFVAESRDSIAASASASKPSLLHVSPAAGTPERKPTAMEVSSSPTTPLSASKTGQAQHAKAGTGLGLPICKTLVTMLGGAIRLEDEGHETVFEVMLPLMAPPGGCPDITPLTAGTASAANVAPAKAREGVPEHVIAIAVAAGVDVPVSDHHRCHTSVLLVGSPLKLCGSGSERGLRHSGSSATADPGDEPPPLAVSGGGTAADPTSAGSLRRLPSTIGQNSGGAIPAFHLDVAAPVSPIASADATPTVRRPRVLVVDDEPVNQRVCARMLAKLGCDVDVTGDGSAVVDRVMAGHSDATGAHYDVILLDIMLGHCNGVDIMLDLQNAASATASLTGMPAGSHTLPPVLAMTGNTSQHDAELYREAGFSGMLGKPFSMQDVQTALQSVGLLLPRA